MVKNKSTHKKTKNNLLKKDYYQKIIMVGFLLLIPIGIGAYLIRPENLGPKLPAPPADALYKQAQAPIDDRVQDLISRMTLEEKIGQMALVDKGSLVEIEDISKYYLGGVLSGAGAKPAENTPKGWLEMVNSMKEQAAKSRLGIPLLYGVDANHGHANVLGATVYPHAIGLGASQNANLVNEVAAATSEELIATGVNWSYSPSLDAPKDMRWGRVYEAFSDNLDLNGKLGASYVSGTQTPIDDSFVLATAKHYLGNGGMVWDKSNHEQFKIDQGKTIANETLLTNEYLVPFKNAVDAGVSSVMVGLNQWGNTRVIDSDYLITDKLKNELGFKGFVVSDWYGVYEYSDLNRYKSNIKTINAGLDMAMLPYDYKTFMQDVRKAANKGLISQSRIDDAVSRILYQKFRAGLFDVNSNNIGLDTVGSETHRALALKAVSSSAVLLKNQNALLPLPKDSGRILVAGSGADNVGRQCGAWTIEWQGVDGNWMPGGTSILQGIKQVVGTSSAIDYRLGGNFEGNGAKAKVGIVVVSEKPYAEGWGDNANPTIDDQDLEAIANTKRHVEKVVVVVLSGRPLFITDQEPSWDALIAAWLPGSEGAGIADVLFGNVPFAAKLPVVWPANIQQVPIKADGSTKNGTKPLFERGYGL